jgi:glucans biosynthesis protein C
LVTDLEKKTSAERLFYIDFLRVFAIILMFIYHVSMIFVAEWDWHIKNAEQSNVLMEINYWMAFFRMPLLFFVSGFISCVLLDRHKTVAFIFQRFNRLIIPTVFGTFLLVAPQIYFERRLQGVEFSYLEFYRSFLQFQWWPNGNFHWLHLWFIPYLFFYNVLSIPVYRFLQGGRAVRIELAISGHKPALISLFVAIAVVPYTFLSVRFPVTYDLIHDYARHSFFIFFILAGVLAYKFKAIMEFIESKRALLFQLALASILAINVIRWNGWEPQNIWDNWLRHPLSYAYIELLNFNSWLWVLMVLGYGKRYFNKGSQCLDYCNRAVYPFYILHQTVIVIVGYYVVQTQDNAALKYLFLLIVCFFLTGFIYHLYIKPFKYVRFVFGVK